jgi:hypothetical protein
MEHSEAEHQGSDNVGSRDEKARSVGNARDGLRVELGRREMDAANVRGRRRIHGGRGKEGQQLSESRHDVM